MIESRLLALISLQDDITHLNSIDFGKKDEHTLLAIQGIQKRRDELRRDIANDYNSLVAQVQNLKKELLATSEEPSTEWDDWIKPQSGRR